MKPTAFTRRDLIYGTGALLVACTGGGEEEEARREDPTPRTQAVGVGCYAPAMAGFSAGSIGCGILSTFGDPFFDARFTEEIFLQRNFFNGIPATVYVFDECSPQQAGAYSTDQSAILMGRWIVTRTIIDTRSELPIAGILAHEWAHQIQFRNNWMRNTEPTTRKTELEADMWSGFYMALGKAWAGTQMQSYFQMLFSFGDFNFNDRTHHGTPNQRMAAGAVGLELGRQVMLRQQPLSYAEGHAIFLREIDRIVTTILKRTPPDAHQTQEAWLASLPWPANVVAEGMDNAWIAGVARGTRELKELASMPPLPMVERVALFPYQASGGGISPRGS